MKIEIGGKMKPTKLLSVWRKRLELCAEGEKLWIEADKLRARADKLWEEADNLWAEAIREVYGNIKVEWRYVPEKNDYSCTLAGEVYEP